MLLVLQVLIVLLAQMDYDPAVLAPATEAQAFAEALYKSWSLGDPGCNNGAIFLLSDAHHEVSKEGCTNGFQWLLERLKSPKRVPMTHIARHSRIVISPTYSCSAFMSLISNIVVNCKLVLEAEQGTQYWKFSDDAWSVVAVWAGCTQASNITNYPHTRRSQPLCGGGELRPDGI